MEKNEYPFIYGKKSVQCFKVKMDKMDRDSPEIHLDLGFALKDTPYSHNGYFLKLKSYEVVKESKHFVIANFWPGYVITCILDVEFREVKFLIETRERKVTEIIFQNIKTKKGVFFPFVALSKGNQVTFIQDLTETKAPIKQSFDSSD